MLSELRLELVERAAPRTSRRRSTASRRRDRRGGRPGRRRARGVLRPLPAAGRARLRRPARRARLGRRDRPHLGARDARDAAARAGVHVADRPLHRGAHARALARAAAPLDALPRRRARAADAARVQPRPRAGRRRSPRSSERYRRATMGTLRVAFLSGSVLELAATLGVALVAVTVGVRLVDGGLGLQAGLTVLVLAPELYLPLRQLGAQFHASADGLAVAERMLALARGAGRGRPRRSARAAEPGARRGAASRACRSRIPSRPGLVLDGLDLELRPGRDGRARRRERRGQEHGRERCSSASPSRRAGRVTVGGVDLADVRPGRVAPAASRGCRSARRSSAARSPTTSGSATPDATDERRARRRRSSPAPTRFVRALPDGYETRRRRRRPAALGGRAPADRARARVPPRRAARRPRRADRRPRPGERRRSSADAVERLRARPHRAR